MDFLKILFVLWASAPIFNCSIISSVCQNLSSKCKCVDHILDCSQVNLTDLDRVIESPTADRSFFKIVNFSFNDLKILKRSFTAPFHKVETFDFSHNNLHKLENHNFVYNPNLKFLDLSHNVFHEIKKGQFAGLDSNLRALNLSYNLLSSLESDTFFHLRNLENLDLRSNFLTRLERGTFGSLTSLKILNLDDNDLATLSCKILTKLETLSLMYNSLTNFPILGDNTNFKNLFLDGNFLGAIQTNALSSTPNVMQISMKNMHNLKSVEKCAFCGLPKLKRLILSKNRHLTEIGTLAFGTEPLTEIDLSENKLTTLPFDLIFWDDEHKVKLKMGYNPWNCDCQMKWILNDGFREMIEDDPR
uniref:Uncharacterized protein n=1 Tax=Romanomermis culicivorax TaxID=13658 RepID=A0A915KRJ1_ROMCU